MLIIMAPSRFQLIVVGIIYANHNVIHPDDDVFSHELQKMQAEKLKKNSKHASIYLS